MRAVQMLRAGAAVFAAPRVAKRSTSSVVFPPARRDRVCASARSHIAAASGSFSHVLGALGGLTLNLLVALQGVITGNAYLAAVQ